MIWPVISCICLLLGLVYCYLIHWALLKWHEIPVFSPERSTPQFAVSVLVAARNEAENIGACIQALLKQNYPAHLFQVIVIDDHSSDTTVSIVKQFEDKRLSLLSMPSGQQGKKAALELGIANTESKIILTTDADCQPPPEWIHLQVQHLENRALKASTGPVMFTGKDATLYRFQALDISGMMIMTAVGLSTATWTLGNGANMAYYRADFKATGGYKDNRGTASGDDIFLIAKLLAKAPGKVQFLKSSLATVPTEAAQDRKSFFFQRLRWGTKNAAAPSSPGTTLALGTAFLLSWSIILAPFAIFWTGYPALLLSAILLALKSWADYRVLKTASHFFNQPRLMHSFVLSEVIHIGYIAIIGLASLVVRKYDWKGRTVE